MPERVLDAGYVPRWWRCEECRRVMGVVLRDGQRVRRLYVLDRARADGDMPSNSSILAEVKAPGRSRRSLFRVYDLDQGIVACGACGSMQEWGMSLEALDDLVRRKKGLQIKLLGRA
jgi:hypothetical protein